MPLYASDSTINKGEPYRNYIEEDSQAGKTSSVAPSNDYIPTAPDQTYSEASGVPHFVDQSGGIYPVMHNSVLFDHTPEQTAQASKPKLSMEDYLYSIKPPGGFEPSDYAAKVYEGARVVAHDQGIDLNSERGKEWLRQTIKGGDEFAPKVVNQTPPKDRYLKTGQDSYFDTVTKQVIQGPLDKQDADMQLNAHLHEVANKNAQAQGEGAPSPTAYIPPSADLQTPQMTLQDQGAPNPAGYIPPQTGQPASTPAPQSSGGIMDAVNQMNSIERERFLKRRGIKDPNPELSSSQLEQGGEMGVKPSDHLYPGTDVVNSRSFMDAVGAAKHADKEKDKGEKMTTADNKRWDHLIEKANPLSGASSRTGMGVIVVADEKANRVLKTLAQKTITNQEAAGMVEDIGSIYKGGSTTENEFANQQYKTLYGSFQKLKQEITGKPQDALPEAIKQRLATLVGEMKSSNLSVLNQWHDSIEAGNKDLISKKQDEWDNFRSKWRDGIAGGSSGQPPKITSQKDFDTLPSGTVYISKDGNPHRKP